MGGCSAEREVSLKSGAALGAALKRLGYSQVLIDVDREIPFVLKQEKIDIAFIALHGRYGEDGAIQGLLETMQIPYTGSGVAASAAAMNKITANDLFLAHRLPIPPTRVFREEEAECFSSDPLPFDFPVVVKPASEGSSIGVTIVEELSRLPEALEAAFRFGPKILIQQYISGKEIHVGILGERVLGAIEIRPKADFYDYSSKYILGMSEHLFPAPLPPATYQKVLDWGMTAHRVLGCSGYSRVDFLIDSGMRPHLLELNTLPGMTETSLMPEMAAGVGIDFDSLVEEILSTAATGK